MKCVKLKIYPKGYGREIYRVIAVDPKKLTFNDLKAYMIHTFDLDTFSHLYEFVYKAAYVRNNALTDCGDETTMDERVFDSPLPKTFYFHYDFAKDWYFAINIMSSMEEVDLHKSSYKELKSKGEFVEYSGNGWDFK